MFISEGIQYTHSDKNKLFMTSQTVKRREKKMRKCIRKDDTQSFDAKVFDKNVCGFLH